MGPGIEVEIEHMTKHHEDIVVALKQGLIVQRNETRFSVANGPEVGDLARRLKTEVTPMNR